MSQNRDIRARYERSHSHTDESVRPSVCLCSFFFFFCQTWEPRRRCGRKWPFCLFFLLLRFSFLGHNQTQEHANVAPKLRKKAGQTGQTDRSHDPTAATTKPTTTATKIQRSCLEPAHHCFMTVFLHLVYVFHLPLCSHYLGLSLSLFRLFFSSSLCTRPLWPARDLQGPEGIASNWLAVCRLPPRAAAQANREASLLVLCPFCHGQEQKGLSSFFRPVII